jgi:hypothetical protein
VDGWLLGNCETELVDAPALGEPPPPRIAPTAQKRISKRTTTITMAMTRRTQ